MEDNKLLVWVLVGVVIIGVVWFVWQQKSAEKLETEAEIDGGFEVAGVIPFKNKPLINTKPITIIKPPAFPTVICKDLGNELTCQEWGCRWQPGSRCLSKNPALCLSIFPNTPTQCARQAGCEWNYNSGQCRSYCYRQSNQINCQMAISCHWPGGFCYGIPSAVPVPLN